MKNNNKILIKSNNGVSLISLVITIIIIVILAAVVVYNGYNKNIEEATVAKMFNEFVEVENAITQRGYEHKLDSEAYPYESSKEYTATSSITINNIKYEDGYYLVTPSELEKLDVTSASREYVVNYSTGDVILKEPFYWDNKEVYTKKDLLEIYTKNNVITEAQYDEKKGVNRPILLDGMLPVKYNGTAWYVTSVNDEKWYDYSPASSGGPVRYANVMLLDDTTLKDSAGNLLTNEKIRGMNIENLVGMQVQIEGSMFVWVPRYTYKEEGDGSISIVYSNLTKDYTGNGYVKSPAFYYGEYTGADSSLEENSGYVAGGKELTGIWISKYQAGYLN